MKWISKDIGMFLSAKDYIDTVILPLFPVSFDDDIKQAVSMTEFITLLSVQLENQFKGRMLLLPGYSYLKSCSEEKLIQDVKEWEKELYKAGFQHIFYLTSDSEWKGREEQLEGTVLWIPSIPLEDMDEKYKLTVLENQLKQLLDLFVQKWK